MAVLWGDPNKGPHGTFTKFAPGYDAGMHLGKLQNDAEPRNQAHDAEDRECTRQQKRQEHSGRTLTDCNSNLLFKIRYAQPDRGSIAQYGAHSVR